MNRNRLTRSYTINKKILEIFETECKKKSINHSRLIENLIRNWITENVESQGEESKSLKPKNHKTGEKIPVFHKK